MNRKFGGSGLIGMAIVALSGCGGGGGSGDSNPIDLSPGGFYTTDTGNVISTPTLITEAGNGWLIDPATSRSFALTLDTAHAVDSGGLAQLSGTITAYDQSSGSLIAAGSVQVSRQPRAALSLSYSLSNGITGSYAFDYQTGRYTVPGELSLVAGGYTAAATASSGSSHFLSMSIDASGKLSATDSAGCTYSGTVAVVNPSYNAYQIAPLTETCSDGASISGLSGQATVVPAYNGSAQQLSFSIANGALESFQTMARTTTP